MVHCETFRRKNNYPRMAYEVGTEEVHGGLADVEVFNRFLSLLKKGLKDNGLEDVWPCFVVGKVGTDLHTTTFDAAVAEELTEVAAGYGSLIKGHYSDNVRNPQAYPLSGMGAANVGPEFTECEYEGLMELCELERQLWQSGEIARVSFMKAALWDAVITSGRWKKWLHAGESAEDFYANTPDRQEWLVKTGCRYIWENAAVLAARNKLYCNMKLHAIEAEEIVLSHIEQAMDKYFYAFNLVDVNDLVAEKEVSLAE
jgi:hypothetical protein